ncbi:MAG: tetratricopeptide repeat protein, partial [Paludibacteraceae bacterium]|nr:tetratricopeptide repeat protein [Paludibacteraceae bacterium]
MKRNLFILTILSLFALPVLAQDGGENALPDAGEVNATPTWSEANQLYADGNYQDAIAAYEAIIAETPSAEAYYNLGNAYFKTGEVALSILAYERSLRLRPHDKDTQHNLQFAQQKIIDNIQDNHRFFLAQWAEAFRNLAPEYLWFRISVALFILMLVCAFLFAFAGGLVVRKIGFH